MGDTKRESDGLTLPGRHGYRVRMSAEGPKNEQTAPPRRRIPIPVRVLVFLVLYVYSIGPMFWFWYEAENLGGSSVLRAFYAPLRLLCGASHLFEDFLNRYIDWWIA